MNPAVFVVDTNVVAAGLITGLNRSPVAQILDAMLSGMLIFLLSPALLDEYRNVLLRPKLSRLHGLDEQEIDRILEELTANAIWREARATVAAPDRGDDHLWALLAAHADSILVTGDRLLLAHPPDRSSVISPKICVDRFLMEGRTQ
ncbi:MAG: putative toxin-antitoxin system toxin component, PIN family [Gammaproteobacteria bacterium]|nr:putative toxin-antitoxin system toxin component, PIN family [Gammaproteobacteria bacterium]